MARCQIQLELNSEPSAVAAANPEIRLLRLEIANSTKQRPTSVLINTLQAFFAAGPHPEMEPKTSAHRCDFRPPATSALNSADFLRGTVNEAQFPAVLAAKCFARKTICPTWYE